MPDICCSGSSGLGPASAGKAQSCLAWFWGIETTSQDQITSHWELGRQALAMVASRSFCWTRTSMLPWSRRPKLLPSQVRWHLPFHPVHQPLSTWHPTNTTLCSWVPPSASVPGSVCFRCSAGVLPLHLTAPPAHHLPGCSLCDPQRPPRAPCRDQRQLQCCEPSQDDSLWQPRQWHSSP